MLALILTVPQSVFAGEAGKLTHEVWNNIDGSKVENLTVLPQFHGGADSVTNIDGAGGSFQCW